MAESSENLDNFLHDWEKDKNKKSIVEALNRYKKHSLAGIRMIKPFSILENGTEKNSPAVHRRTRLNQTQNWLVSRELLLTKPNKQNVYEIDSFNKFNFSQSHEILDTLIDVRNAKQQNTTS